MLTRLFASRGFLSFGLIAVLIAAAVVGYQVLRPEPKMRAYCAEMPDAIGLFTGSDVTVLGVRVGRVTGVHNNGATAHVDFEIPASRKLPTDVGATTLADALIANRKLALVGPEPAGPGWDPKVCITKAVTPKSMSETFTALANLADQLNGAQDPAHPGTLSNGLHGLNNLSTDTGPQINTIISKLGVALNNPDAAIGHIGSLIDAITSLADSAATYWPQIKDMLTRLSQALDDVSNIAVPPVLTIIGKLVDVLPALNDVTVMLGGPLVRRLDAVENLPQLIRAGVQGLHQLITMAPALASAFTTVIDPETKSMSLAYAPPRVAIPAPDAAGVCAAVNAVAAGACADAANGMVNVPLTQVILGTVGAR